LGRIKSSIDDPLGLEIAGHAIYDLYPERRGNLFSEEVYRLSMAADASTTYHLDDSFLSPLPPNQKFRVNDIILLTLQPQGSGDFFDPRQLPTSSTAVSSEGRVIGTGPTYIDVALSAGAFEIAFGPAPNDQNGSGNRGLRLRADRFFSNVPYTRMVSALTQLTSIPDRSKESSPDGLQDDPSASTSQPKKKDGSLSKKAGPKETENPHASISMDELLKEAIISTHAFTDPDSLLFHDVEVCNLQRLVSCKSPALL